jgi:acyl-CoA synthetase (NDP forming)
VFANAIGQGIQEATRPVVYVNQVLQPITTATKDVMAEAQVPYAIPGLRQAVVALRNVAWWSGAAPSAAVPPGADPGVSVPEPALRRGSWSEPAARHLLAEAGIPVVPAALVTSAAEAARAAARFGGPVALKLASPDVVHKSDLGGVRLDVSGDGAVAAAFEAIQEAATRTSGVRLDGVLVSPMRPAGTELLIGVARDPTWGPLLAVATGGVLVEVLDDIALSLLPVTPSRARELLLSLRGAPLLRGVRGAEPADVDAVAQVVARLGDLALALGDDVESLEVNPLRVDGGTVEALDATVTWTRKENE